jgi:hypothetical protein
MQRGSLFLSWAFFLSLGALPVAAEIVVTLEPEAVVASGVTASGQVVLLGVTREIAEDDFPTVRRHLAVLADEDGDGVVRYPLGAEVPAQSVWAVADLTSGEFSAAAPKEVVEVEWVGRGLERRGDGKDVVEGQKSLVELLVVRPEVGAWTQRLGDGDERDGDGVIDGRLSGLLEEMKPLAGSPEPPAEFQKDDLVLSVDPFALEISVIQVSEKREGK